MIRCSRSQTRNDDTQILKRSARIVLSVTFASTNRAYTIDKFQLFQEMLWAQKS
jgi:hypothetical protein